MARLDANFSNLRHLVTGYKLQVKTAGRYLHGQFPGTRSTGGVGWVRRRETKYRERLAVTGEAGGEEDGEGEGGGEEAGEGDGILVE